MKASDLKVGHDYRYLDPSAGTEFTIRYHNEVSDGFRFYALKEEAFFIFEANLVEAFVEEIPKENPVAEESALSALDVQVGGDHYKTLAIQPWEIIVANNLDFFQGNIIKYVMRYKSKNGLEDLKKARHYLDHEIERLENGKCK